MICSTCRRETSPERPFCERCGALLPATPPPKEKSGLTPAARLLVFGGVGCAGMLCLACSGLIVLSEVPDLVGLVLSSILAWLPAVIYITLVLWLDRYEHEPALLLFLAFFWGSVIAIVFSFVFNTIIGLGFTAVVGEGAGQALTAFLAAPWVEEAFKGIGLLVLVGFFRDEWDNALDGIVYGSLVGFGFALTENIVYFGRQYAEGGLHDLALIVVLRAILGGTGHALYTGTIGAAIGYAREVPRVWARIFVPVIGYLAAVAQHGSWNFFAGTVIPALLPPETGDWVYFCLVAPIQSVLLTGPGTVVLAFVVIETWRREASIIREQLLSEVSSGLISREDYAVMSSSRRRIRSLWHTLTRQGALAFWVRREYIQAATELAFRKWHVARGEQPKRGQRSTEEEEYRARIRSLQARLA